ncbi:hypothetical protein HS088_TW07G00258 [Tripterygium wilfordii]|uniref:Exonuclease V chloroplastic n=1 Tax=Tripterygium wilfordii TaxID=458696 RepID=A0A7J7DEE3_TRIWF|nr:exonuclease V, chloroplastic-like [Tripterygium wilfordii]KAF5744681.1 hypothetical protein HS088_TW07G00258 [Tripterygium wilfordii]
MSDSQSVSFSDSPHNRQTSNNNPTIPIEIVSEEEMALLEAALAATRSSFSSSDIPSICSPSPSSQFQMNARCVSSITLLSKRGLSCCSRPDIEDFGGTQKRNRVPESLLQRFRKNRALSVTDFTNTEWCEKQTEFSLLFGKRKVNKAMKAGSVRHAKLEEEIVKKVKVRVKSAEDIWALKFLNFITGANQLQFEGLTRELPLIGFVEGVWLVGVMDEIRLPLSETNRCPVLVDTKTRVRDTLPAEPQRRNGRLQLMCYKYLWDSLVAEKFSSRQFFEFFSLDPYYLLCEEIHLSTVSSGFPAKTLNDVVRFFRNTCSMFLPAHEQLLLRYELQKDNSVLAEDHFTYDPDWLKSQLQRCLEFWLGEREASFVPEEEQWKCHYCQFAYMCPATSKPDSMPSPEKTNTDGTPS